jgi:hypothetical protein
VIACADDRIHELPHLPIQRLSWFSLSLFALVRLLGAPFTSLSPLRVLLCLLVLVGFLLPLGLVLVLLSVP